MFGLYAFIYMLIGVFVLEIIANISLDIGCDGAVVGLVLFFWPLCIVVAIFIGIVYGVMSLGAWLGTMIRRTFIERESK